MASGFPTGAYCSKASQTPMSFCAAGSASTCTRTREGMSSIVLLGFLVSRGLVGLFEGALADWQSWPKTASGDALLRSTGLARRSVTAVVMGTYSEKARGGWGTARNLATDPGVLATDDRAPSSRGGGEEKYAGQQNARLRHPHATPMLLMDTVWVRLPRTQPTLDP